MPVRDPNTPDTMFIATGGALMLAPSPFWGTERIWKSQTSVHNPMFDEKGRVWLTARIRPPANPAFCKKGSDHPSAKLFPVERAGRHLGVLRSENQKVHAHRYLLQHAPFGFCRGRQQHAVAEQRRLGQRYSRLAQYEDVRRDRRRAEVAGLDGVHPRHQRQRQARRIRRARPTRRSDKRQTDRDGLLRHRREPGGRLHLGIGA